MPIAQLLTQVESQELEYKASFDKSAIQSLVTFANSLRLNKLDWKAAIEPEEGIQQVLGACRE